MASDQQTTASSSAAAGRAVSISFQQQLEIGPLQTLRFDKLVSDSRCPIGAHCIAAGEAVLAFTLNVAGKSEQFQITSGKPAVLVQGLRFSLAAVEPVPRVHIQTPETAYKATVLIN
ncbi:MAG: hypothetical protein V4488_04915 [Pseudomonadota bacterium]